MTESANTYPVRVIDLSGSNLGPFSTNWPCAASAEVKVYLQSGGVTTAVTTDLTIATPSPVPNAVNVTLGAAHLPEGGWDGHKLILWRDTPVGQDVPFGPLERYSPVTTEEALDKLTRITQDHKRSLDRTVSAPMGEAGPTLPPEAERAGRAFVWGPLGEASTAEILGTIDGDVIGAVSQADLAAVGGAAMVGYRGMTVAAVLDRLPVDVRRFGVVADGVTDDTEAWQDALDSGENLWWGDMPTAFSLITDKLIMPAVSGQKIFGIAAKRCMFLLDYHSFNMAASCVIQQGGAEFQGLKDIGFRGVQPSTAVRANIKTYPWAFDCSGGTRPVLENILMERCFNGIKGVGNCGGARFVNIEAGCWGTACYLDGALDSVNITNLRSWPYGAEGDANLLSVFADGAGYALKAGRIDDLNMEGGIAWQTRVQFDNGGDGNPAFGSISGFKLDATNSFLDFISGNITWASGYFTTDGSAPKVLQTGGRLRLVGWQLDNFATSSAYSAISLVAGDLTLDACHGKQVPGNASFVNQTGGSLHIANLKLNLTVNAVRTQDAIRITGGRANLIGIEASDAGTGTGKLINITNDENHYVAGIQSLGWGIGLPATTLFGEYQIPGVSFNRGSDIIANGTSSKVIAYGLGSQAPAAGISIQPHANPGSNGPYLDPASITATHFTVRTNSAVGADTGFSWNARLQNT